MTIGRSQESKASFLAIGESRRTWNPSEPGFPIAVDAHIPTTAQNTVPLVNIPK